MHSLPMPVLLVMALKHVEIYRCCILIKSFVQYTLPFRQVILDAYSTSWNTSFGTQYYFLNGKSHREMDLPAIESADGTKVWCKNGEKHRDGDLPAVEWPDGKKEWYKNGVFHRREATLPV